MSNAYEKVGKKFDRLSTMYEGVSVPSATIMTKWMSETFMETYSKLTTIS